MNERRGEFAFIADLAKKAATAPEALGLEDDAAVLWFGDGRKLVLAADMLQAGVHTLADARPAQIASKALRANLSDLAAMGAQPAYYLSTISWAGPPDERNQQALTAALVTDQETFGITLIGGDTICGQGPFTISITVLGWASGPLLRRVGAQVGDDVWLSGTIGDGWLGLGVAQGNITKFVPDDARHVVRRYEYPEPRLVLGTALAPLAHCALDVSDGLIADAAHLAKAGDCSLCLDPHRIPLSHAAHHWLASKGDQNTARQALMSGGDDYELVFTACLEQREQIEAVSRDVGVALTRIGRVEQGQGVMLTNAGAKSLPISSGGFTHF